MRRRGTVACIAVMILGVGCSSADGPSPEWPMVHDSSGVQIVEVGPLDERVAFRVGAEPEYVLGWAPGDYLFQFGNAGVLLSDGRAAVTDRGAGEIVVIARSGVVESVLGGRGEGPGSSRDSGRSRYTVRTRS